MELALLLAFWSQLKISSQISTVTHLYQIGKKSHYNNTLKKHVFRNVKSTAKNAWRETVKNKCYQVWQPIDLLDPMTQLRTSLSSTPYGTVKKEKEELQKKRVKVILIVKSNICFLGSVEQYEHAYRTPQQWC